MARYRRRRRVGTSVRRCRGLPETPEQIVRREIDRQLEACGWIVQDRAEADVDASVGVAIREFPLHGGGEADYLLYAAGKAIGIVEAKPEGFTLTGVEIQSAKYTRGLPDTLPAYRRPLPFAYRTLNGCNWEGPRNESDRSRAGTG